MPNGNSDSFHKNQTFYPIPEVGNCPKCKNVRFESQEECFSCGLVFEKYEKNKKEQDFKEKVGGIDHLAPIDISRLESLWKTLVTQYNDVPLHDQFLRDCMEIGALPFACWNYKNIQKINPDDLIAPTQLEKIKSLMGHNFELASRLEFRPLKISPYLRWLEIAGLLLGSFLIVFGAIVQGEQPWLVGGIIILSAFLFLGRFRRKVL